LLIVPRNCSFVMTEKEMRHACSPLSVEHSPKELVNLKEEVGTEVVESDEQVQSHGAGSSQPTLSKARTIALVATLTGVSSRHEAITFEIVVIDTE
jgi:hypothetical protein